MTLPTSYKLYSVAARLSALVISAWGALLGLFAPMSLTAQVHDTLDGPMDVLNVAVLCVAAFGLSDVSWHDIRGKLMWPSFDPSKRHAVCVGVYSSFGATWLLKCFVAASAVGHVPGAPIMMSFALSMAGVCGVTAVALALEQR